MAEAGYAAASREAAMAYVPPGGTSAIAVGKATYHFLNLPITFSTWEFLAIAWLIWVMSRHWGKFVNDVT